MNPLDDFRRNVEAAVRTALDAGADRRQLNRILTALAGVDPQAWRDAADHLDGLIDGQEGDDLGSSLSGARDILRHLAAP